YKENYTAFKKLVDYVEYKRIPIENYIYEIPIIDPLSTNNEEELLTEIQIQVKKREIDLRCLV
ncbi:MerR family transcriptional regulator, partial [Clostridioides difficile]|nr:MerR family transcriptional regulator [Clostridioides difficile]